MDKQNTLGVRLLSLRAKRKINQAELAKELGVSRSYLSSVENGHKSVSDFLEMKISKMESEISDPMTDSNLKRAICLLIDADTNISDTDFNKYFKGFLKGYERGFNAAKERISPNFAELLNLKKR